MPKQKIKKNARKARKEKIVQEPEINIAKLIPPEYLAIKRALRELRRLAAA